MNDNVIQDDSLRCQQSRSTPDCMPLFLQSPCRLGSSAHSAPAPRYATGKERHVKLNKTTSNVKPLTTRHRYRVWCATGQLVDGAHWYTGHALSWYQPIPARCLDKPPCNRVQVASVSYTRVQTAAGDTESHAMHGLMAYIHLHVRTTSLINCPHRHQQQ